MREIFQRSPKIHPCYQTKPTKFNSNTTKILPFRSFVLPILIGQLLNVVSGIYLRGSNLVDVPVNISVEETQLDLSHNSLVMLLRGAFDQLPNLVILNLDHNSITLVENGVLRRLCKLKHLCLKHNNLDTVPDMSGLSSLIGLYLSYNHRIRYINVTRFDDLSTLRRLTLISVGADNVDPFPSMSNLEYIYLGENEISRLQQVSFQALKSLRFIGLAGNKMATFPYLVGVEKHIRILDLKSNRLYVFPEISAYLSLQELDLSNNFITSVPETSLATFSGKVIFTGNPIICVTELCWLFSKRGAFTLALTCRGETPLVKIRKEVICQGTWEYWHSHNRILL